MVFSTDPYWYFSGLLKKCFGVPVIVVSNGSFGVGGVHPSEEDSPIFEVGTTKNSRSGRVGRGGQNCLCGKDSSKALLTGVVVKDRHAKV